MASLRSLCHASSGRFGGRRGGRARLKPFSRLPLDPAACRCIGLGMPFTQGWSKAQQAMGPFGLDKAREISLDSKGQFPAIEEKKFFSAL